MCVCQMDTTVSRKTAQPIGVPFGYRQGRNQKSKYKLGVLISERKGNLGAGYSAHRKVQAISDAVEIVNLIL